VTYQLKILTTALFSVIMLGKPLSRLQWVSLFILFCGVALVQVQPTDSSQSNVPVKQNPFLGLVAVLVQCCLSGFAGVYFEKILKGTKQSIWLRNVQLGVIGSIIGFVTMEINDGQKVSEKGFFFGYDYVVWTVICLQSFGGLVVAVVVKYADNILKGFATSGAIIISCIAAIYFFNFQLSLQFFVGATLVIVSVYMYSKFVPPQPPVSPPSSTQNV
jgi:UDP-sugar transporter A1/2/3